MEDNNNTEERLFEAIDLIIDEEYNKEESERRLLKIFSWLPFVFVIIGILFNIHYSMAAFITVTILTIGIVIYRLKMMEKRISAAILARAERVDEILKNDSLISAREAVEKERNNTI